MQVASVFRTCHLVIYCASCTKHCGIVQVVFAPAILAGLHQIADLLIVVLCRWLLHPKPAIVSHGPFLSALDTVILCRCILHLKPAVLDQVPVLPSLLTEVLPALLDGSDKFMCPTHCNIIVQVGFFTLRTCCSGWTWSSLCALLIVIFLCRWLLHPEPSILAGLDQVPVLPALLFPLSHGAGVHQRSTHPVCCFHQCLTVLTVSGTKRHPHFLTGCPELLQHWPVLLALFSAPFHLHCCFSPGWIPGTSVHLWTKVWVTGHKANICFEHGEHWLFCETIYTCVLMYW